MPRKSLFFLDFRVFSKIFYIFWDFEQFLEFNYEYGHITWSLGKKRHQPRIESRVFSAKLVKFALALFSVISARGKILSILFSFFLGQYKRLRKTHGVKMILIV